MAVRRPRRVIERGVTIEWDEAATAQFLDAPNGELGRTLMAALGEIVLIGAKKRVLYRTGRMHDNMHWPTGTDEQGIYVDIGSRATDPDTGFPYPIVHEGRKVRDRRPHRSLRPALRDIKKIETAG